MRLYALLLVGLSGISVAQATEASPVAELFRAQIGDSTASLLAALKAESWQWNRMQTGIVTHETTDVTSQTTYWLRDGRVSRIYRVVELSGKDLAPFERAYQSLHQRVHVAAGREPVQTQTLPTWFTSLGSSGSRYALFTNKRLVQSASWTLDATWVSVIMRAEQGGPVVLMSAEPLTASSDQTLAKALLELHPPASPERRAASARTVALCAREQGVGALSAALRQDPEVGVRKELVHSLGRVPSPVASAALATAARTGRFARGSEGVAAHPCRQRSRRSQGHRNRQAPIRGSAQDGRGGAGRGGHGRREEAGADHADGNPGGPTVGAVRPCRESAQAGESPCPGHTS